MSTPPAMPPWAPAGVRYAGFWIRVFANVLDVLTITAVNMAVVLVMEAWFPEALPSGVGSVSGGVIDRTLTTASLWPALFIVACWIWKGATPGKMMCRLRIVDEATGGRPTAWQCIGRYVMALAAVACVGIGYVWIAIDPRKQGWHDKIVRTLVLQRDRAA